MGGKLFTKRAIMSFFVTLQTAAPFWLFILSHANAIHMEQEEIHFFRDDSENKIHAGYQLSNLETTDSSNTEYLYHADQDALDYETSDFPTSELEEKKYFHNNLRDPEFRVPNFKDAVSFQELKSLLPQIGSGFDLLRIQYGHWISDEEISDYFANTLRANIASELRMGNSTGEFGGHFSRSERAATYLDHKIQRELNKLIEGMDSSFHNFHTLRTDTECENPRPVLFNVSYFYPNLSAVYVPSSVILHRCDPLFCSCESGQICSSAEREIVNWDLFVMSVEGSPDNEEEMLVKFDSVDFLRTLKFVNHTRCECQYPEMEELKKLWRYSFFHSVKHRLTSSKHEGCKVCPNPFNPRRSDNGCMCDCFDMQHECLQIKKGEHPLTPEGLRCIKHGVCQKPACSVGVFDADNGFCPRKPPSSIRRHMGKRKKLRRIR